MSLFKYDIEFDIRADNEEQADVAFGIICEHLVAMFRVDEQSTEIVSKEGSN